MTCARVYRRQTHFPSRETLQHDACCPRASPPRTVSLSIILQGRENLQFRALPNISRSLLQRATDTARNSSADSAQSARKSRLLQASASGRRQQRTLLYFISLECRLASLPVARSARRDCDTASCAIAINIMDVHGSLQDEYPADAAYGKLAVHAEYWRHTSLPASLTQTLPLGCSQTAVSVVNHTAGSRPSQHVVAVLPTKPVHSQLLAVSFPPTKLPSCHPDP